MAREFKRSDRVGDAIQRNVAQLIQQEIRDPRIGMVNINDVVVTRDLAYAKVYVTFVGSESDEESVEAAKLLNKASGFLRAQLSKEMNMRSTPRLTFYYDKTAVHGQALSHLIDKAVASDRKAEPEAGDGEEG
jgi:ribosome-binding factor A